MSDTESEFNSRLELFKAAHADMDRLEAEIKRIHAENSLLVYAVTCALKAYKDWQNGEECPNIFWDAMNEVKAVIDALKTPPRSLQQTPTPDPKGSGT